MSTLHRMVEKSCFMVVLTSAKKNELLRWLAIGAIVAALFSIQLALLR